MLQKSSSGSYLDVRFSYEDHLWYSHVDVGHGVVIYALFIQHIEEYLTMCII